MVVSNLWDNGTLSNAGALTFGSGTTGVIGAITSLNSAFGATASTSLQNVIVIDNPNDAFFGRFLAEIGGKVRVGSQDSGFPTITAPSDQTAYEDVEQVIDGISIVDAGDAVLTFTLGVSHGTLSLGTIPVTLAVAGNGTGSLTLIGTSADINAALDSLFTAVTSTTAAATRWRSRSPTASAAGTKPAWRSTLFPRRSRRPTCRPW